MNDSTLQKAHLPAAPRTRRVFLTRAAALGITSATAGWLWNQRPRAGTVAISAAPVLGLARFLPLTGTVFTSAAPDALPGTELTLTEAPLPFSLEDGFFHGALVEVGTCSDLGAARGGSC